MDTVAQSLTTSNVFGDEHNVADALMFISSIRHALETDGNHTVTDGLVDIAKAIDRLAAAVEKVVSSG